MGCHVESRAFEAPNEKSAIAMAARLMERARDEHGHDSYAGHIGICDGVVLHRTPKPLTMKQAEKALDGSWSKDGEHIEGLVKKWGPAVLVRVRNKGSRKARWLLVGRCAS